MTNHTADIDSALEKLDIFCDEPIDPTELDGDWRDRKSGAVGVAVIYHEVLNITVFERDV